MCRCTHRVRCNVLSSNLLVQLFIVKACIIRFPRPSVILRKRKSLEHQFWCAVALAVSGATLYRRIFHYTGSSSAQVAYRPGCAPVLSKTPKGRPLTTSHFEVSVSGKVRKSLTPKLFRKYSYSSCLFVFSFLHFSLLIENCLRKYSYSGFLCLLFFSSHQGWPCRALSDGIPSIAGFLRFFLNVWCIPDSAFKRPTVFGFLLLF